MKSELGNFLPQSEDDWLKTGEFETGYFPINDQDLNHATVRSLDVAKRLTIMVGGIPRDPERQKSMPLINKLYGRIALLLARSGSSSLIYSHPGTGKSSGEVANESIGSNIDSLIELTIKASEQHGVNEVAYVGMSAGSYMAARAARFVSGEGINVSSLVLQSPAAYPMQAEFVPYSQKLSKSVRSDWGVHESPVFKDLEGLVIEGSRLLISYCQHDNPPIPERIQAAYFCFAERLMQENLPVAAFMLYGVEHNFRRLKSDHNKNVVNNDSVRAAADTIVEFISA